MEELAVSTGANLVNGRWVEIDKERAGDVFAAAGLGEEGLEGAAIDNILGVGVGATVRAKAMLEEVSGESQCQPNVEMVGRGESSMVWYS